MTKTWQRLQTGFLLDLSDVIPVNGCFIPNVMSCLHKAGKLVVYRERMTF